jgi:hypothetical protein
LFLSHCSSDFISFLFSSPLSAPCSVIYHVTTKSSKSHFKSTTTSNITFWLPFTFWFDFSVCEIYKQSAQGIFWRTVLNIACQPEPFPANQSCYITSG